MNTIIENRLRREIASKSKMIKTLVDAHQRHVVDIVKLKRELAEKDAENTLTGDISDHRLRNIHRRDLMILEKNKEISDLVDKIEFLDGKLTDRGQDINCKIEEVENLLDKNQILLDENTVLKRDNDDLKKSFQPPKSMDEFIKTFTESSLPKDTLKKMGESYAKSVDDMILADVMAEVGLMATAGERLNSQDIPTENRMAYDPETNRIISNNPGGSE